MNKIIPHIKGIIICIFSLYCFCGVSITFASEEERSLVGYTFSPPTTEAEKKLDYIMHLRDNYDPDDKNSWINLYSYISKWPHTQTQLSLEYNELFTKEFIYAWSEGEKSAVDKQCNGKYREDTACGVGPMMLSCYKKGDKEYLYRTIEEKEDYALIQYTWASRYQKEIEENDIVLDVEWAVYRMVKRDNIWLLDGRKCGCDGAQLNFKNRYINN